MDKKTGTLVAYVDFHNALDKVSIPKLLNKLKHTGIRPSGKLLDCISSLLYGRTRRIKVNNVYSNIVYLIGGVPQGSVLGPILFIIYINDNVLNQPPHTISKLYADDLKCYNEIINKTDSTLFADTLDHINEWSLSWQLPVAAHECQIMRISNKNSSGDDPCQFRLGTYMLSEIDKTEDLGLLFNS